MARFRLRIGGSGPVIDLGIWAGRSAARALVAQGQAAPSPQTIRALIDTGADRTAIHPSVTVPDIELSAPVFPSRILCFLRFLLFQDDTNNMHPLVAKADRLSGEVIGAAIEEVHRIMGPGLFNFHEVKLVDRIARLHLPGADQG